MAEFRRWSQRSDQGSNNDSLNQSLNQSLKPADPSAGEWREVRGGQPMQRNSSAAGAPSNEVSPPLHMNESDHWLGRIALYYVAHPTIPNLYHCCFDYIEPWDWSRETEHLTTGLWIRRNGPND